MWVVFKSEIIKQMVFTPQQPQIILFVLYDIGSQHFKNRVDQLPAFKNQDFKYQAGNLTSLGKN